MAPVQLKSVQPFPTISTRAVPPALKEALAILYEGNLPVWLVGGTALAGYYAEHRRSDDLDLFATTPASFTAMLRQATSLKKKGATFSNEISTPNYFHAEVEFQKHTFTLDIVLDENLPHFGSAFKTGDNVEVASLDTLFCMKAACLVSRCSEKDLFDLDWLFSKSGIPDASTLIAAGNQVDAGVTVESLLLSLKGTFLKREACNFILPSTQITADQAYQKIIQLQKKLIALLLDFEKKQKENPVTADLKKVASLQKKILADYSH